MNIDKALPDEKAGWVKAAVDQYTRNGTLYGVPALTDGRTVVYYNKKLLSAAASTRASCPGTRATRRPTATWPRPRSSRRTATWRTADQSGFDGKKLSQYGTNIANDLAAHYYNFIGSTAASSRPRTAASSSPRTPRAPRPWPTW